MLHDLAVPSDLVILGVFIVAGIIISILIFLIKKNFVKAILFFSLLSNIAFVILVFAHSLIFTKYNIEWLKYFSMFIWPLINVVLVIIYRKQRDEKKFN